jgi:hypothetical protein
MFLLSYHRVANNEGIGCWNAFSNFNNLPWQKRLNSCRWIVLQIQNVELIVGMDTKITESSYTSYWAWSLRADGVVQLLENVSTLQILLKIPNYTTSLSFFIFTGQAFSKLHSVQFSRVSNIPLWSCNVTL